MRDWGKPCWRRSLPNFSRDGWEDENKKSNRSIQVARRPKITVFLWWRNKAFMGGGTEEGFSPGRSRFSKQNISNDGVMVRTHDNQAYRIGGKGETDTKTKNIFTGTPSQVTLPNSTITGEKTARQKGWTYRGGSSISRKVFVDIDSGVREVCCREQRDS